MFAHSGRHKALMIWMTALIYAVAACVFIGSGHCCSQHSHGEGEAHGESDHVIAGSVSDVPFSELMLLPNEPAWSKKHCCGQGLHNQSDRISLHGTTCQRSIVPNRVVTWLSLSDEPGHWQPDFPHAHSRSYHALNRASARSPALESILTVSLLI